MRRLLLVDDERSLLDGLTKVLRPWRHEWEIETALGGRAALEALSSERSFAAVVSDARMPDVDGEAVLRAAQERQPLAVRIILSGQVDARVGHRLAAASHQFLTKPSSGAAIMAAVEECCRLTQSLKSEAARTLVASLGQLPVAPHVYHRVTALIAQPSSTSDEIARLISDDLVLTSSVLRFVNSAFFGLPRSVDDVREAIVLLGLERLRELVLLVELFPEADDLGLLDGVRRRGLFRSQLARLITQGSAVYHLASEAALLTEVGVYALAWKRPALYRDVWRRAQGPAADLEALEREAFGATNAEVASALLGLWRIPNTVVNAVRWNEVRPSDGAALDARTATALAVLLTREALNGAAPGAADALAAQLGVDSLLPSLRLVAARGVQEESVGPLEPSGRASLEA
jgi:HD-like signal output (HDOD) protein